MTPDLEECWSTIFASRRSGPDYEPARVSRLRQDCSDGLLARGAFWSDPRKMVSRRRVEVWQPNIRSEINQRGEMRRARSWRRLRVERNYPTRFSTTTGIFRSVFFWYAVYGG